MNNAFTVENIEDEINRLKSFGVTFDSEEYFTLSNGTKLIFFKGPEGEKLELFQPGV
ncbi:VOC family protein [Neobacillus sp. NRS-1170]|uniref:VOC family protein n=1 Tax=Neobacillus sp. NRS-1170 TaxID=3233898 RepID=UPI003D2C86C0